MRYLGKIIRWIPDTFPPNYSRKYTFPSESTDMALRLRSAVRSGTTDEGSGFEPDRPKK
jgi:hypothetical protein